MHFLSFFFCFPILFLCFLSLFFVIFSHKSHPPPFFFFSFRKKKYQNAVKWVKEKRTFFCTHHFFSFPTHFTTLHHQYVYLFFIIQCRFPSNRLFHPLTPYAPYSKPTLTLFSTAAVVRGPGGRTAPHTPPPLPNRRHMCNSHTHTVAPYCHPLFFPTHTPPPTA